MDVFCMLFIGKVFTSCLLTVTFVSNPPQVSHYTLELVIFVFCQQINFWVEVDRKSRWCCR